MASSRKRIIAIALLMLCAVIYSCFLYVYAPGIFIRGVGDMTPKSQVRVIHTQTSGEVFIEENFYILSAEQTVMLGNLLKGSWLRRDFGFGYFNFFQNPENQQTRNSFCILFATEESESGTIELNSWHKLIGHFDSGFVNESHHFYRLDINGVGQRSTSRLWINNSSVEEQLLQILALSN